MRLCWSGAAGAERLEQVETGGLEGVGEVRVDGRWAVVGCHGALTPRRDGASPVRKGPACAVRGEPLRGGSIQGSMEKSGSVRSQTMRSLVPQARIAPDNVVIGSKNEAPVRLE